MFQQYCTDLLTMSFYRVTPHFQQKDSK